MSNDAFYVTSHGSHEEIALKYQISPEKVYTELKRGKASGPDNLTKWILKEFATELSSPVAIQYKTTLQAR